MQTLYIKKKQSLFLGPSLNTFKKKSFTIVSASAYFLRHFLQIYQELSNSQNENFSLLKTFAIMFVALLLSLIETSLDLPLYNVNTISYYLQFFSQPVAHKSISDCMIYQKLLLNAPLSYTELQGFLVILLSVLINFVLMRHLRLFWKLLT